MDRLLRNKQMRDIPFEAVIEHTVDFIQLVGTPGIYTEKTAIVPIHNWQGLLPCDFYKMLQVRAASPVPGRMVPGGMYRATEHSFHLSPNKMPDGSSLTYKIQDMVIFTSTKEVDLEIVYYAFAVDDEGYPLLPDNVSFLRGLETYIKMKWFEEKFEEGKVSQAVMDRIDREYGWAVGDADSEFSRLTLDEAETLFNSFKTLLPRNNEHWKAFFTQGAREIYKTH